MKKTLILLTSLLIMCLPLLAQELVEARTAVAKQFPTNVLNMELRFSTELQRLYFQLEAIANKADIDDLAHNGFFLPKTARIQGVWLNGKHIRLSYMPELTFNPPLEDESLLAADSPARFFILEIDDYPGLPEQVEVRINYYINMPPFKASTIGQQFTFLDPDCFWYPRNLSQGTNINFKLITTPRLRLSLGGSLVPYSDHDYKREHTANFTDDPAEPLSLRIIRD
ncbi:MAG: hypothetical protein ACOYIS_02455 [Candidatus Cloacimonadaceae bacterium]|jgi:hypothetical protein